MNNLFNDLANAITSWAGRSGDHRFISADTLKRLILGMIVFMVSCTGVLEVVDPPWAQSTLSRFGLSFAALFAFYISCSVFFGLYVSAVSIYQQHLNKTLPISGYVFGGLFVVTMLLVDVFFQYLVFSIVYWEWPKPKEYTVTQRLQRWVSTDPTSRKGRWSANLCKLLNLFTPPNSPHCGPRNR